MCQCGVGFQPYDIYDNWRHDGWWSFLPALPWQILIVYQLAVRIIMKMRHSVSAIHSSRLMMTFGACWGMVMYSDGL